MNVYDFDNTLYHGESSFDFALFCLRKKPSLILLLPQVIRVYLKHKKNQLQITDLNHIAVLIFDKIATTEAELQQLSRQFWEKNLHKLNHELLKTMQEKDVIITACPDFLIQPLTFPTNYIFCTEIDFSKVEIKFICYRENKCQKWQQEFPNQTIAKLYTDSYSDQPLMDLAQEVYLITKGQGLGTKVKG